MISKYKMEKCNHLAEEERVGYISLFSWCHMAVSVLCLFLTVPWVGLQCVIVAFLVILTYFSCAYVNASTHYLVPKHVGNKF